MYYYYTFIIINLHNKIKPNDEEIKTSISYINEQQHHQTTTKRKKKRIILLLIKIAAELK